ncbi:hypothetical protein CAPTEDRAFT_223580 [Capitella teleta]|uniref:Uncharacterized protein n=1 Tax=Capitella teleta TaxID=283909 RepID=R7VBH8_CAPTE|nr:hypothetical protein CAPTEDRAFT_223580 [Capitella teleta]|eukprot:ELU13055.1 hypothetical protein CAPTEDRAFT_223580 [Capitella teleta]
MPRGKRRKSLDDRKGRLVFTESPVNVIHDQQSPIFCSDHPPTASVIPVDESMSLQWVSPQFNALPTRERRLRRCRHVSSENHRVTRSHRKTELDITDVHRKYPALSFVSADINGVGAVATELSNLSLRSSKKRLIMNSPSATQKRLRSDSPKRTLLNPESSATLSMETVLTPKRQSLPEQHKVLVYDTPEEDYGLNRDYSAENIVEQYRIENLRKSMGEAWGEGGREVVDKYFRKSIIA